MAQAGYLTPRLAAEVGWLVALPAELPSDEIGRRRFLHRHGRRWATAAAACGTAAALAGDAAGERWRRSADALCQVAVAEGRQLIEPPRLLTGGDVQELLGIARGPRIGAILTAVTAAQVDGLVGDREQALAWVRSNLPLL